MSFNLPIFKFLIISFSLLALFPNLYAQGIKGYITSSDGTILPFASIFVKALRTGTTANQDGYFELKLPAGSCTIRIQNIGFKAQETTVEISNQWIKQDFSLSPQGYMLEEVKVGKARKEDFAYTIMRKTIAKKKYHLLQYNSYEMKVYVKGTGEMTNAPFFLKNKLKKEGFRLNEAYTTESVSQIKFKQPNKVEEKVIAIRTKGKEQSGVSPFMFINQSFYKDKVAGIISPLANSAFRWYKFTYEGSFTEGNNVINKIRVTPRSKGDNVLEGTIYIIEDEWAIHSLDLSTSIMGFPIHARQNYGEVAPHVWMPVTHRYQFVGNVLGFKGHYNYLASCRDYKIELNNDLRFKTEIIDEKIEKAPEEIAHLEEQKGESPSNLVPANGKMSRRKFYKMMDEYEKKSVKKKNVEQIITDRTFHTDSIATKRDSTFWAETRTIPLTEKEMEGYQRDDSLARIQSARLTGKDSTHVIKHKPFNPFDLIGGGNYNLSPRTTVTINPFLTNVYFNTVEGWNVNLSGKLAYQYDSLRNKISFTPTLRYGFSSRSFYAKGKFIYSNRYNAFSLEGGQFIEQFNSDNPIHPHINTLSSLLFRKNYIKLYKNTYLQGSWSYIPSSFLKVSINAEWADRSALENQTDYSFFYKKSREYTRNTPQNIELINTGFAQHQAFIMQGKISYRPIRQYRIYNDKKIALPDLSPEITLKYRKGIKEMLGSDVDFDQIELGLNHSFSIGAGNKLDFELLGGTFLNKNNLFFMDFKHFDGNRTFLGPMQPAGGFRLLDYYNYSTADKYISAHIHYKFRKFLLTRIPDIRYRGIRENIFINYLKTGNSPHYYEVGYSLDNIFRFFRVEVASSFNNGSYKETGVRLGIATMFNFK